MHRVTLPVCGTKTTTIHIMISFAKVQVVNTEYFSKSIVLK